MSIFSFKWWMGPYYLQNFSSYFLYCRHNQIGNELCKNGLISWWILSYIHVLSCGTSVPSRDCTLLLWHTGSSQRDAPRGWSSESVFTIVEVSVSPLPVLSRTSRISDFQLRVTCNPSGGWFYTKRKTTITPQLLCSGWVTVNQSAAISFLGIWKSKSVDSLGLKA